MIRYLLGELSEGEQATLEEKYFTDSQVFAALSKAESELVDDYVRNRLTPQVREQFERFYLAHPKRRERARFAEALATRLDRIEPPGDVPVHSSGTVSWWQSLVEPLRSRSLTLGFSLAAVSLLLAIGGIWLLIKTLRMQAELSQIQTARAAQEQRESELQQLIVKERVRGDQLARDLEDLRNQQQSTEGESANPLRPFVSLILTVGAGQRSIDSSPITLVIPPGTAEVRLQVKLREHNYPSYEAVLLSAGGGEIVSRKNIKPLASGSGASFTLRLPASRLVTGDYILTLQATTVAGEVEEFSKTIFRVTKADRR